MPIKIIDNIEYFQICKLEEVGPKVINYNTMLACFFTLHLFNFQL